MSLKIVRHSRLTSAAIVLALVTALGGTAASAVAAPSRAQVQASEARARSLAEERRALEAEVDAVTAAAAGQAGRLDALVERQEALQARLNSRAIGMYRGGRLDFVDVLTHSTSFADFSTRLEFLTRMNLQDARDLIELRRTKRKVTAGARDLLERQEELSRKLRAAEAVEATARRELAKDRRAWETYAAGRRAADSAEAVTLQSQPAPRTSVPRGAWKTGVASHYGKGSYGRRTADGTVVGPDSMIVAHKTLPFGTMVQFSYRGRTAVARVADRGPYTPGRDWDLGPGVIKVLGFNGVDTVRYRILGS